MKLKLIKPVVVNGHPGLQVGDVFDEKNGWALVANGWCVEAKDEAPAEKVVEQVAEREPVIEHRDPKPTRVKSTLA